MVMSIKTPTCRLHFDLDADQHLVIKDIANRSVLLALVTDQGLDLTTYQPWLVKSEQVIAQLQQAEHDLRKARSDFHGALPHSFIDSQFPREIESGLQRLGRLIDSSQAECERSVMRFKNLNQFFS